MQKRHKSTRSQMDHNRSISKTTITILLSIVVLLGIAVYFRFMTPTQNTEDSTQKPVYNQPRAEFILTPESLQLEPLTVKRNQEITLEVVVDPMIHMISTVNPGIVYDPNYLSVTSVEINRNLFPMVIMEPDTSTPGTIKFNAAINLPAAENAVRTRATVATITLKALKSTGTEPTVVRFNEKTQALSTSPSDGPQMNVISTRTPSFISIE